MNNLHVKTGDNVMIISGKDKGHTGKVLQVSPAEGKVIVEGQNMVTKHVKPRRQGEQGGIVKAEGAMYASKVMPICPHSLTALVGHNDNPRSCPSAPSAARPCVWATSRRTARWFASARSAALSCKKGVRNNGSFERTVCQ